MKKVWSMFLGFIVLVVPELFLDAWIVMLLWRWFVVPILNLPALGYLQAMGISLVIGYLTYHGSAARKKEDQPSPEDMIIHWLVYSVLLRLYTLFIGWILHLFI